MKWISIALTALLFVILGLMIFSIISGINRMDTVEKAADAPDYHFQIITDGSNEKFWTDFSHGAKTAADEKNVYVEFVTAENDTESSVKALNCAVYSGVDGIAFQPRDAVMTRDAVDDAIDGKIGLVTFENDAYYFSDVMAVGSNSYEIGYAMGKMCTEARGENAKVAVIVNFTGESEAGYKSIKVQGFVDAISEHSGITLDGVYTIDSETLEVDRLTGDILRDNPDIDTIVCMDEKNTPSVAQVLVDTNKVGSISVIGYGAMPQTLDYIERNVIYGTVCADGYQIGYNTVMKLYGQSSGKSALTDYSTDIFSVTKENVSEFKGS